MNLGDRRDVSQYFPLSGNGTEAQLPQVGNLAGGPTQRGVRSVGACRFLLPTCSWWQY